MAESIHLEMHQDHRRWSSEVALWRDEISLWQEEYQKALNDVNSLESSLRKHAKVIHDHEEAVAAFEKQLTGHEHALADFEEGGRGEDLLPLAQGHRQKEEVDYRRQREAHERLKKHHHRTIALLSVLIKELTEAPQ